MIVGRKSRAGGWLGMPMLFLAPALILFLIFLGIPAIASLYVSLCRWTGFTPSMQYVGPQNFVRLFDDNRFWIALYNNFYIMLAGGLPFFFFAFLFAGALNSRRLAGRKFFQTMIFFPCFISVVGTAVFWKLLYDAKSGLVNLGLEQFGVSGVQWLAPRNAIASILVAMIWSGVGGTMILLLAGMRRIPDDYYEAAAIDGASGVQQFFQITLPMLREVIIIALSMWMISSLKAFGYVQAMLAPSINQQCHVIGTLQYEYAFSNRECVFLMGRATAMAVVQLAIVLMLIRMLRFFREKESLEY